MLDLLTKCNYETSTSKSEPENPVIIRKGLLEQNHNAF